MKLSAFVTVCATAISAEEERKPDRASPKKKFYNDLSDPDTYEGLFEGKPTKIATKLGRSWTKLDNLLLQKYRFCEDKTGVPTFGRLTGPCPDDKLAALRASIESYRDTRIDLSEGKKCTKVYNKFTKAVDKIVAKLNTKKLNRCRFDLDGFDDAVFGKPNPNFPDVIEFTVKYAEAQRFMAPEMVTEHENHDFDRAGKSCPTVTGTNVGSATLPVTTEYDEDCLFVKIYAPKSALVEGEATKVLSWIHGGTFNFGGVDVLYESAAKLVNDEQIIVAKMNYRLGPFGNWFFPMSVNGQPMSNWQLQDQRMGLQWIHENISKFSGDASDITLGGASAGGHHGMTHLTHEASHSYFHNALFIGPPQINFWTAEEATEIYFLISQLWLGCGGTTPEEFGVALATGELLTCLQSKSLAEVQGALDTALPAEFPVPQLAGRKPGDLFKGKAMEAGRISQLEMNFAPNIDGDLILGNPRDRLKSGDFKSDLGFYLHEIGRDEGNTMVANLFGNDAFKMTLYGENYSLIFQQFNQHVLVPKVAFDGLITTFLTDANVQAALLAENALGCPQSDTDIAASAGGLLTECKQSMSDFITSWMWTCNTADALTPFGEVDSPVDMYAVELRAAKPGPGAGEDGVLMPDIPEMASCYEATEGKSCHIQGQEYLFGEAYNQGTTQTADEIAFGDNYRQMYGELIKTGSSSTLQTYSASGGSFNILSVGESETVEAVFPTVCPVFDLMNAYGLL